MESALITSIQSMEKVHTDESTTLWLLVDKEQKCIYTTEDKNRASPMYEIADCVQFLTNQKPCGACSEDVKKLHFLFQKLWEKHIVEISLPR